MSNIEAIPGDLASRRTPSGLELSGSEPDLNPQEIPNLVENAPIIAASHFALERVKRYANIIGEHGAEVSQKARRAIGVLVIPTLAFVAACGSQGETASVSVAPVPTPATGEAINLTPNATVVTTPEAKVVVPVATATEAPKAVIPEDAQKILNDFSSISVFKPEENEAIAKDFAAIWSKAETDFQKYDSYDRLYGILWAKFNITKDPAILLEMNKVEQTIAQKWPGMYQNDASNNGFYREPGK